MDIKLFDRILALGNLIGQARLGYMEMNLDFQVTSWNTGAAQIFGYSEDDIIGCPLDTCIPIDKEELTCGRQAIVISDCPVSEKPKSFNCEIFYSPIVNQQNKTCGHAILAKDISEQMPYKNNFQQQIMHLEEIYRYAPIGIFHVSLEGSITEANSEFAWMLGYESTDKIINQITDFATQVFFDPHQAEDFMIRLLETEKVAKYRVRLKRKGNPSYMWALCFANISYTKSGRTNGFNGYAVDIRETVKAEQNFTKANEKLKALSVMDGLTQIPNRRKFDECLRNEWNRHIREKKPLSLILCDIDFFKHFNDTYGHQAGDDCLKKVAAAIAKSVCRSSDVVTRYGGEEFSAILPNTAIQGAELVAERIRTTVQNLHIAHKTSTVSNWVSISLGISTLIPEQESFSDTIITMSDKALYRSKANGRNQYCVYEPDLDGPASA
ncbi:MAG: diguanylate cyclase [Desulfotignum sp.]